MEGCVGEELGTSNSSAASYSRYSLSPSQSYPNLTGRLRRFGHITAEIVV